jgi:methylated-DNA-[protein]-cysteine S-methyltransferase
MNTLTEEATMTTYFDTMKSPIGELTLSWREGALVGVFMEEQAHRERELPRDWVSSKAELAEVKTQLREYFAGTRQHFNLPLAASGTGFQEIVWENLQKIPYGITWSYGQLAKAIGNASASRAVGLANGRNPIGIIIPCHRVIGANGTLTGYGGGIERKKWLLEFESRIAGNSLKF